MTQTPEQIRNLVEHFDRNIDSYRAPGYKEAQLRKEFIDPFFEALGWDMANREGNAEAYKDVVHEVSLRDLSGGTKAPDYAFRISGNSKFFVEAKKPSVDIKRDVEPAYQLRRYAWSAKLPLSILTDFEEFAVYQCNIRPRPSDKAATARVRFWTYRDYVDKWDEIAGIFSPTAIKQGSFDKFVESSVGKRGTSEVDAEILADIEEWRDMLAHDIARGNRRLSVDDLNAAVQRTIDRIIFLRMCEDRGIEPFGQLQRLLNEKYIYSALLKLYEHADAKYNSGLFYFDRETGRGEPDTLTTSLNIENEIFKKIIGKLYYPDCPYEFSVLPAEILGNVYEQFLGKVIRLTPSHQARVEEKPEVKKAGGVYYTPKYIVDYIVKNTVGKLCENKTPRQISQLRILDPACGSGSFLIGAYTCLLDYHRDWYAARAPAKFKKEIHKDKHGRWKLTTAEKKRILLNNIYGVDIDGQAVEVTKLSLLLKVLEGENAETLEQQMRLFHERALPDLANNIKCGNSLIGPDYYAMGGQGSLFPDADEMNRINAFDWRAEFPGIFNPQISQIPQASKTAKDAKKKKDSGGFDCVIGNPPWISLSGKFGAEIYPKEEIEYLVRHYTGNTYMPNMYEYFVHQGLNLVRYKGYFSFVVPDRLGFNNQFVGLRKRILTETNIKSLLYKIPFPGIVADTLIFVFEKNKHHAGHSINISEYGQTGIFCSQDELLRKNAHTFEYFANSQVMSLVNKVLGAQKVSPVQEVCDSTSGFGGKSELIYDSQTNQKQIRVLKGDSISRYQMRKRYWFDFKRANITGRTTDRAKLGASPKILLRKTGDRIIATFDDSGVFPEQSLYFFYNNRSDMSFKFLLGVLNSRLLSYYYAAKSLTNKRSIAQVKKVDLDQLPVPVLVLSKERDKALHDRMVGLVEGILALHKHLAAAKSEHEKTIIQRQIDATDREIDGLVYELYGLTEKEIRIVEEVS